MLSITVNLVQLKLGGIKIGPSITGVGQIAPAGKPAPSGRPADLAIPWQKPTEHPLAFGLLSWHTQMSNFAGRDEQWRELERWTATDHPFSIKFLTGEGGVGKSREGKKDKVGIYHPGQ